MRVLSLFDGICCGHLALERAGIKIDSYDAYEIEKSAIKATQANFPDVVHHGDVTKEDFTKYILLYLGVHAKAFRVRVNSLIFLTLEANFSSKLLEQLTNVIQNIFSWKML